MNMNGYDEKAHYNDDEPPSGSFVRAFDAFRKSSLLFLFFPFYVPPSLIDSPILAKLSLPENIERRLQCTYVADHRVSAPHAKQPSRNPNT